MEQNHSWLKASLIAFLLHLVAAALLVLWLAQVAEEKEQQTYIIDLAESNFSQGSGHEGGGGGGGSAATADFPAPLQEAEMEKRVETVQQAQTAASKAAEATTKEPVRLPPPAKSEEQSRPSDTTSGQGTDAGSNTGGSTGGEQGSGGGSGTGTGSGSGSGIGPGEGSGTGGGSGSGSGSGTGDGQGTGDGSGDGQGSGDGNTPGTGSGPFDTAGFRAAINANKEYPTMAIKREMQGSSTIHCVLDAGGNIVSVSLLGSSGHGILDDAALSAARAVGSYPNPTGGEVRVNVTVDFYIR